MAKKKRKVIKHRATKARSYSSRPTWHWVVMYGVIGIVVYGLLYYFMSAGPTTNNYGSAPDSMKEDIYNYGN